MVGSGPIIGADTVAGIAAHLRVDLSVGGPHAVALSEHVQMLFHLHMDDEPAHQHSDPIESADRAPDLGALSVTTASGRHFLLIISEVA